MKALSALVIFFLSFHFLTAGNTLPNHRRNHLSGASGKLIDFSKKKHRPNHLIRLFKKRLDHTRRGMAAALAFPLPFGVLALHRIYLGTQPHVPVTYIGTVGGVFGILPFIDFCVLVLDSDIQRFSNNGKVFMWIEK